jgi:ubiquitin-protein ligase
MSRTARRPRAPSGSAREIRLQKDLSELNHSEFAKVSIPDPKDIFRFLVRIKPNKGMWQAGAFDFEFTIPGDWPMDAPKVTLLTRTWHPNVTEDGQVCLSLLKDSYTPVMTIGHLVAGLQFLFMEPCTTSPLNTPAAKMLQTEPEKFQEKVDEYIQLYCHKS